WLQGSRGGFGRQRLFTTPLEVEPYANGLAIGDLNSDGRPDVAIGSTFRGVVVFRQGEGSTGVTRPQVTIDSGPGGLVPSFHATTPGSSFQCQLGGNAYSACSSPFRLSGLDAGDRQTLHVRAIGPNGAIDPIPAYWHWTVQAPPPNDNFANAQVLLTDCYNDVAYTNKDASKEAGEPDHAGNPGGASIWFTWKPGRTGTAEIGTAGSDFDTL